MVLVFKPPIHPPLVGVLDPTSGTSGTTISSLGLQPRVTSYNTSSSKVNCSNVNTRIEMSKGITELDTRFYPVVSMTCRSPLIDVEVDSKNQPLLYQEPFDLDPA